MISADANGNPVGSAPTDSDTGRARVGNLGYADDATGFAGVGNKVHLDGGANRYAILQDKAGNTFVRSWASLALFGSSITLNAQASMPNAGQGILLKSPDGLTTKRVTIDNLGALALI